MRKDDILWALSWGENRISFLGSIRPAKRPWEGFCYGKRKSFGRSAEAFLEGIFYSFTKPKNMKLACGGRKIPKGVSTAFEEV